MFDLLGRCAATHPWKVCAAWLVLAVAPSWRSQAQDDDIRILPPETPSVRGFRLLEQAFPQDVFARRTIFAVERPDEPLTEGDFELVDAIVTALDQLRREEPALQIGSVVSYRDSALGKRLVSADRHCTLITLSLTTPYLAVQTRAAVDKADAQAQVIVARAGPDPPRLYVTGPAGIGRDLV